MKQTISNSNLSPVHRRKSTTRKLRARKQPKGVHRDRKTLMIKSKKGKSLEIPVNCNETVTDPLRNIAASESVGDVPEVEEMSSEQNNAIVNVVNQPPNQSFQDRRHQEKRLLIRRQLVVLLHAIVCQRRGSQPRKRNRNQSVSSSQEESELQELDENSMETEPQPECIVPYCSLMKGVISHMNGCNVTRDCGNIHCRSSRQILRHWRYCVQTDCPLCAPLRKNLPMSMLAVFPNPLCRAEMMIRMASTRRQNGSSSENTSDQLVPHSCEE